MMNRFMSLNNSNFPGISMPIKNSANVVFRKIVDDQLEYPQP